MNCEFCNIEINSGFLFDGCRRKLTEFMFNENGFGFLATSMCCIDLDRLLYIVESGVIRADAGTLPTLRRPSELEASAKAMVAGLAAATSARYDQLKEAAKRIGICMSCKVPNSIPIGGRPIEAPDGSTIYSAKCVPCTKRAPPPGWRCRRGSEMNFTELSDGENLPANRVRWDVVEGAKRQLTADPAAPIDHLTAAERKLLDKLTCPWCGWNEIERPMLDVGGDRGLIEGLAECEVCGAEEIDPAELDSEPNHRDGWRQAEKVKMYDPEKHGPLREGHFAISCGADWQAYTTAGHLVRLPEDHRMVQNCKDYNAAMNQINARVGEPTGG
jgi:hypothetical protein